MADRTASFSIANVTPPDPKLWRPQAIAAAGCLFFLVLGMAARWLELPAWLPTLCLALSFTAGLRFPLPEAVASLRGGHVDVDMLMMLVAAGAWSIGHAEEGATLLVLFGGSRAMEAYAQARTRSAIESLSKAMPSVAHLFHEGVEKDIGIDSIAPGDLIVIRPSEVVPVDCLVIEGGSSLDASSLTGEADRVPVSPGTEAGSGAVNGTGRLLAQALRPARESAYQKIISLIESAPDRKSPAQLVAEKVGRIYTAAILFATCGALLVWWLGMTLPFREALYRAMVLLVAGSPCALVLSIPSAVLSGIAAGARLGILFNGGKGLLSINSVKSVAFDKTGTLSTGLPEVVSATGSKPGTSPGTHDLSLALVLSSNSNHPVSRAISGWLKAGNEGVEPVSVQEIHEEPGQGVVGTAASGTGISLGRDPEPGELNAEDRSRPHSALVVGGQVKARFFLREQIRATAGCAITWLRARGLRVLMLSGDSQESATAAALRVGLAEARGGLQPGDKHRLVKEFAENGGVIMVGDGVNDAPALAAATVGVAMGMRGSAAALAEADVVLVRDELLDLVLAIDLGHRVQRIVRQNMAIAVGAAAVMIAFALAGSLPLVLGVFGHEGGTVLVVLNSLRLLLQSPPSANHGHAAMGLSRRMESAA